MSLPLGVPYLFTKGWFMQQFPDYGKLPDISSNGKILYVLPVELPAAEKDDAAESSSKAPAVPFPSEFAARSA